MATKELTAEDHNRLRREAKLRQKNRSGGKAKNGPKQSIIEAANNDRNRRQFVANLKEQNRKRLLGMLERSGVVRLDQPHPNAPDYQRLNTRFSHDYNDLYDVVEDNRDRFVIQYTPGSKSDDGLDHVIACKKR